MIFYEIECFLVEGEKTKKRESGQIPWEQRKLIARKVNELESTVVKLF